MKRQQSKVVRFCLCALKKMDFMYYFMTSIFIILGICGFGLSLIWMCLRRQSSGNVTQSKQPISRWKTKCRDLQDKVKLRTNWLSQMCGLSIEDAFKECFYFSVERGLRRGWRAAWQRERLETPNPQSPRGDEWRQVSKISGLNKIFEGYTPSQ